RAPTPLELACSNPAKPCLLEGFLVSDPPLQQVVARTKEAGLRGNVKLNGAPLDWKLGLFRTDSQNDIIQVASVIQGRGVFQNVPATRRQVGGRGAVPSSAMALLCELRACRCHLSVCGQARLAQQPVRGCRWKCLRHPRRSHPRHSAAPDQERRRLRCDARSETRYRPDL